MAVELVLRFVHFGMELQACIDAPLLNSMHFQGSFFPREVLAGEMMIEPNVGDSVISDLRVRGHIVTVAEPWCVGRLTAALRETDRMLRAAMPDADLRHRALRVSLAGCLSAFEYCDEIDINHFITMIMRSASLADISKVLSPL